MKYIYITILLFNSCFLSFSQEYEIVGKLISEEDNTPIVYAAIVDVDNNRIGTTSNLNGVFKLSVSSLSDHLYITSLGYKDTTICVSEILNNSDIILHTKKIILDEVVVTPNYDKIFHIGKPFTKEINKSSLWGCSKGSFVGSFFKIKNGQKGIIKSISIYIGDKGYYNAPFTLRLLTSKQKIKANQMYTLTDFIDILKKPIQIIARNKGWCEIDLSNNNIHLPASGLFIFIIPLDVNSNYEWKYKKESSQTNYGISIATYNKKINNVFSAIIVKDKSTNRFIISYQKITPKWLIPPAVGISYYIDKTK